jgi:hypothetical protein
VLEADAAAAAVAAAAGSRQGTKQQLAGDHKVRLRLGEDAGTVQGIKITTGKALILWLALVAVFLLVLPQLYRRKRARSRERND